MIATTKWIAMESIKAEEVFNLWSKLMGKGRMARILEADMKRAQGKRADRTEGLQAQISTDALMSAVRHEGKYIMGSEGKGYWRDMQRRYPHLNLLRHKDTGDSPNGHFNRHGKVSYRFVPGVGGMAWKDGEWQIVKPASSSAKSQA